MLSLDMYASPEAWRLLVAVISMSIGGASKSLKRSDVIYVKL